MAARSKIRTLIVEDSKLYQVYMKRELEKDEAIEVCGAAYNGSQAREMAEALQPDVITLDLQLSDTHDLSLLKELLLKYPHIGIIVVTSNSSYCEQAIELGAGDFLEKVSDDGTLSVQDFSLLLRLKVKTLSTARRPIRLEPLAPEQRRERRPQKQLSPAPKQVAKKPVGHGEPSSRVIALGASLGGTEATLAVLQDLPADMPGIVVVQHMPANFTRAYAMRLNAHCQMRVKEAENGDLVEQGLVLVAKGGEQLTLAQGSKGFYVKSQPGPKVGGFCPAVNVLFDSVAQVAGRKAVGVILTGLGRDGATGLLNMRRQGAYTIGQDEQTCVVYGMPKEAYELGAVAMQLPLDKIGPSLRQAYCK